MLSKTFQDWSRLCILCQIVLPTLSPMTDTASSPQWSSHSEQNIDLGYTNEPHGSSPPAVPGSLPKPLIRGDACKRETSLQEDHSDSAPSAPQDLADTIHGLGHAAEYVIALATQGLRTYPHTPGTSFWRLVRLKGHPQIYSQVPTSLFMWSVIDSLVPSPSREGT